MSEQMKALRVPSAPESGESREGWERRVLRPWRNEVKRKLLLERGPFCERGCGRRAQDLDEAVVPRCDMRGLSLDQRRLAFCEVNLALLCAECNRNEAHDREGAWERACQRYGEAAMRAWYAGLGLKAPRREWMPRGE